MSAKKYEDRSKLKSVDIRARVSEQQKTQFLKWAKDANESISQYILEGINLRHDFLKQLPANLEADQLGNYSGIDLGAALDYLKWSLQEVEKLRTDSDIIEKTNSQEVEKEFYKQLLKWLIETMQESGKIGDQNNK